MSSQSTHSHAPVQQPTWWLWIPACIIFPLFIGFSTLLTLSWETLWRIFTFPFWYPAALLLTAWPRRLLRKAQIWQVPAPMVTVFWSMWILAFCWGGMTSGSNRQGLQISPVARLFNPHAWEVFDLLGMICLVLSLLCLAGLYGQAFYYRNKARSEPINFRSRPTRVLWGVAPIVLVGAVVAASASAPLIAKIPGTPALERPANTQTLEDFADQWEKDQELLGHIRGQLRELDWYFHWADSGLKPHSEAGKNPQRFTVNAAWVGGGHGDIEQAHNKVNKLVKDAGWQQYDVEYLDEYGRTLSLSGVEVPQRNDMRKSDYLKLSEMEGATDSFYTRDGEVGNERTQRIRLTVLPVADSQSVDPEQQHKRTSDAAPFPEYDYLVRLSVIEAQVGVFDEDDSFVNLAQQYLEENISSRDALEKASGDSWETYDANEWPHLAEAREFLVDSEVSRDRFPVCFNPECKGAL